MKAILIRLTNGKPVIEVAGTPGEVRKVYNSTDGNLQIWERTKGMTKSKSTPQKPKPKKRARKKAPKK